MTDGVEDLGRRTVAQVMITAPKTLSSTATVVDVRAAFERDHVHLVLLVDEKGVLQGTVARADLDAVPSTHRGGELPARSLAQRRNRVVAPEANAEYARRALLAAGERRLAVREPEGRLVGLLCLKKTGAGFCSDADVEARAAERVPRA